MKKCIGKLKNGKPCSYRAKANSDYCGHHIKVIKKNEANVAEKHIEVIATKKAKPKKIGLFNASSKYYAIWYFSLIPIFAFFYYLFIPSHFYHPTSKYEYEFFSITDSLSKNLVKEFQKYGNLNPFKYQNEFSLFYDNSSPEVLYSKRIKTESKLIDVQNFKSINNSIISFTPIIEIIQTSDKMMMENGIRYLPPSYRRFVVRPTMTINLNWNQKRAFGTPPEIYRVICDSLIRAGHPYLNVQSSFENYSNNDAHLDNYINRKNDSLFFRYPDIPKIYVEVSNMNEKDFFIPFDMKKIDPTNLIFHRNNYAFSEERFLIFISEENLNMLQTIHSALRGFPVNLEGGFSRFLYLSASTITTLGLGDIQPTTTLARLVIVFESLLGMVLIGLFLNSIASENSRND